VNATRLTLCMATALALTGCGGAKKKAAPRVPEAGYVVVQPTTVPTVTELTGRTTAYESADVRPQITGVIQKRLFTEGSIVQAGQALYQIDPSLYRASTNQAQANLAAAQATAEAAKVKADRYKPLVAMQAVAAQDYTDATGTARQAAAAVQQNAAALETARINLKFTTLPAPITGRIGRSMFTVGALVTSSQTDALATIQRLDPIYVDIQQSAAELLALRRALASGGANPVRAAVKLKLEDGSDYGLTGDVEFAEVVVNESTGTVTLRARFANPQGVLLPGMFVRADFAQSSNSNAFLVPQAALTRDPKGTATVFLVGPGNKAIVQIVTADRTQGAFWVVTGGLKPGDKVITQGTANIKPGAAIKPVTANSPQRIEVPKQKDGKPAAAPTAKGG